ncbi:hypothetical protein BO79DRAFT_208927 [Aspergillus costaricaensis CBS 115574]|uniref:Uncharacterized protein n=1 Tax=Aspergillus costaricaensis CBS 115574 TaxID=1448317 RepID=A0ACD1IES3_9EURO|nr:hypothetical protein BO79DRAFT_208927 [Aspergillus costaricaensis CBS 115574]RAK88738.1 hypothetical protein BO79DRAFT_208927 [Aspergillus costaricaensis CBS 115574]
MTRNETEGSLFDHPHAPSCPCLDLSPGWKRMRYDDYQIRVLLACYVDGWDGWCKLCA